MPHGNTDWGKDYYHKDEQGKVSNFGRTYTGTGPVTWNHDHTPYGVSDLNGNVSGLLYVSVYEYTKGEEHDAKAMFGGTHLVDYIVYTDNGDIEKVTDSE